GSHASGAGPARARHRLRAGPVAPSQGPDRTPVAHATGSAPRPASAAGVSHVRGRGGGFAPVSRRLQTAPCPPPRGSRRPVGASPPPAAAPAAAWRRPPRDLPLVLSCRYTRAVARDNTVRLGPRWLQLPPGPGGRSWAGRRLELRECLDGRLVAFDAGRLLAT